MYGWIVLLHVLGAFIFAAAHGVSMVTDFQLRGARERPRQVALLDASGAGVGAMYIGLLILLAGGIWAGFAGDHWGRGWIWAAIEKAVRAYPVADLVIPIPNGINNASLQQNLQVLGATAEELPDCLPQLTHARHRDQRLGNGIDEHGDDGQSGGVRVEQDLQGLNGSVIDSHVARDGQIDPAADDEVSQVFDQIGHVERAGV